MGSRLRPSRMTALRREPSSREPSTSCVLGQQQLSRHPLDAVIPRFNPGDFHFRRADAANSDKSPSAG